MEALLVVFLGILFGFRPVTLCRMELTALEMNENGYGLTEAFRKGYTVPKRRMTIPWANFAEVKNVFRTLFLA